jgi:hypothetical protein
MRGNIPIPELPFNEEVWLTVSVTLVRQGRTQLGKPFRDARACNSTGSLALNIWAEALGENGEIRPGLWGVIGKLETFQNQTQFVVSKYKTITLDARRLNVLTHSLIGQPSSLFPEQSPTPTPTT